VFNRNDVRLFRPSVRNSLNDVRTGLETSTHSATSCWSFADEKVPASFPGDLQVPGRIGAFGCFAPWIYCRWVFRRLFRLYHEFALA